MKSNCDYCNNYCYDEILNYYYCAVNLDEDEMSKFIRNTYKECPHFQHEDDYKIVRKQI